MIPDPIFDHCGDDEAEQRWEDMLDAYDKDERNRHSWHVPEPLTNRQLYAMRVSWLETERHMKLRKSVKQQWNAQNPPQEEDTIMNAGRKTEDPSIKDAGLSGVAEAAVDPRLMPDPELVAAWEAQNRYATAPTFVEPEPLREGASIYNMYDTSVADAPDDIEAPVDIRREMGRMFMTDDEEAHGLGRFKQGMPTPQSVAERSVPRPRATLQHIDVNGSYVIVNGVVYRKEETVEQHLIRLGVTYKHRTAAKTGRVWLNVPADTLARAEGRPYTKEKKK